MTDLTPEQLMRDLCAYGFSATMDGQRIDPNDIYLTAEDAPMTNEQLAALDAAATQGVWALADWQLDDGPNRTTIESSKPDIVGLGCTSVWPSGIAKMRVAELEEGDNPEADGEFIVATVNAYRAGQLVVRTEPLQARVGEWMGECFPPAVCRDLLEHRGKLVEEALELAQTLPAFTAERAHALVDYVFSRPIGLTEQEVGGVSIALAALCHAEGIDRHHWAEVELARISTPEMIEKIRAKQASKPHGSALPIHTEPSEADVERVARAIAITGGIDLSIAIEESGGITRVVEIFGMIADHSKDERFDRWRAPECRGVITYARAAIAAMVRT